MQRQQRLVRELNKMEKSPPQGICVTAEENFTNLKASIVGPSNSPYRNGIFDLKINVPDNYPFSPPTIRFLTKIYHPNIDDSGRICMDLLKLPPAGNWKPTLGLEGLLIALRMLLENPNPDDPLMVEIAAVFKIDKAIYDRKAQEYTEKYAIKH